MAVLDFFNSVSNEYKIIVLDIEKVITILRPFQVKIKQLPHI